MRFRSLSFRRRFTLWAIVSLVVLPLVALLAATGLYRFVGTPIADRGLESNARRLAAALAPCWRPDTQASGALSQCLDERLHALFPRQVAYARLLEMPLTQEAPPAVLAKSHAMLSQDFPLSPETRRAVAAGRAVFDSVPPYDADSYRRVVTLEVRPPGQAAYVLQLGLDLYSEDYEPLMKWPHLFWVMLPLLLLGGTIWGFFFMKRVFAPVHEIVALAQKISAENLSQRIEGIRSDDEIGELVSTLNAMLARLERSFQQMEQFSSDVAHELRTPLTIVKGEAEVALKRERSGAEYRGVLVSLLEEAERLEGMIEDLLLLARMESGSEPPRFGAVELDALVLEVYEGALAQGQAKGVSVAIEPLDEARVEGEAGLLKRLLGNLVRNAVSYTPAGGRVSMSLATTEAEASVAVRDTGCGIPSDALPRVFDRFYRVDPSRSHDTGGTGLGLAIVQKVAAAHGARVEVESRVGGGSTFRVIFRRA